MRSILCYKKYYIIGNMTPTKYYIRLEKLRKTINIFTANLHYTDKLFAECESPLALVHKNMKFVSA